MCSSCAKNRAALMAQRNRNQLNGRYNFASLENITFHELFYIGPPDVEITSVIPNVSYGKREFGTLMNVAAQDYELNKELWTYENPNITNNI